MARTRRRRKCRKFRLRRELRNVYKRRVAFYSEHKRALGFILIVRVLFTEQSARRKVLEREKWKVCMRLWLWKMQRYWLFNTPGCLRLGKRYFVCFVKTASRKPGSKGFAMTESEEGGCARARARGTPRASTKDAKVPATVKASKMWGSVEGAERKGRYYRVGMLRCYYSRNSGISPLFKETQYVFWQKVKYFVYGAE